MPRTPGIPTYRKLVRNGRTVAVVTLKDCASGRRRTYYLGAYDSPESRERYARIIAQWTAQRKTLPQTPRIRAGTFTIVELCWAFTQANESRYSKSEWSCYRLVLRLLRALHGATEVARFGPNALREVRAAMVAGEQPIGTSGSTSGPLASPLSAPCAPLASESRVPRRPWSRAVCNGQVSRVRAIFRWAASRELLPAAVYEALRTVEALRVGQTTARETAPVGTVPAAFVDAVREHVARPVWAMICLQRLTGMRPGEVVLMRGVDLDLGGEVWEYRPQRHKTQHLGHSRIIPLGPKAQEVLRPHLSADVARYLFSPTAAEADRRERRHAARRTPAGQGNDVGTNLKAEPRRRAGDRYTTNSYRRAIARGCDAADAAARAEAAEEGRPVGGGMRLVPRWHPHQIRHSYATEVRRRFGLEAAGALLGHRELATTQIYAEVDRQQSLRVAAEIG